MINKFTKKPQFTHFLSLPFIRKLQREQIADVQKLISAHLQKVVPYQQQRKASNMLAHLTLSMLDLYNKEIQAKAAELLRQNRDFYIDFLRQTKLKFPKLGYFTRFNYQMIYLQVENDENLKKVKIIVDKLIRQVLEYNIVRKQDFKALHIRFNHQSEMYENQQYHLTLFRFQNTPNNQAFKNAFNLMEKQIKPLIFSLDFIDISTRFDYDASKFYNPLARVVLQSK